LLKIFFSLSFLPTRLKRKRKRSLEIVEKVFEFFLLPNKMKKTKEIFKKKGKHGHHQMP
jgi:hypothetical protein